MSKYQFAQLIHQSFIENKPSLLQIIANSTSLLWMQHPRCKWLQIGHLYSKCSILIANAVSFLKIIANATSSLQFIANTAVLLQIIVNLTSLLQMQHPHWKCSIPIANIKNAASLLQMQHSYWKCCIPTANYSKCCILIEKYYKCSIVITNKASF